MTKVFFVRHAQPDYSNHNDLLRQLSPQGMEDRKLVTAFLSDKDIDVIISSPYKRAVDTIADLAEKKGLSIEMEAAFRERKIDDNWIEDFSEFAKRQWSDFNYKLSNGESLKEVQERNISALQEILKKYPDKNIAIGSHGTALSMIINYYDRSFGYDDFEKIKNVMPWIVELVFDENGSCTKINRYDIKNR